MKIRYLFALSLLMAVLSVLGLRYNYQRSFDMQQQILDKDIRGENVVADLEELRQFVFEHMNASARVELAAGYERAVGAAQSAVGGDLYTQAQAECDRRGVSSVDQASCVQQYLNARLDPASTQPNVNKSDFTYTFASPGWSPDLAGFGLLGMIGFGLASLVLYIIRLFKNRPEATL